LDFEESTNSPSISPRVGTQPVVNTRLISPSNNFDGMASHHSGVGCRRIDSLRIGGEVRVDDKGSLNRSISHDLVLDVWDSHKGVRSSSEVQIIGVADIVAWNALELASRSVVGVSGIGWNEVWLAVSRDVVQESSHQSTVDPVSPGGSRVASIAAVSAEETAAGKQIFRGDSGGGGASSLQDRGNTDSVADGFRSSEGPAGAAGRLVSDVGHSDALGPVISGVEVLRDGGRIDSHEGLGLQFEVLWGLQGSHQLLDIFPRFSDESGAQVSLPSGLRVGIHLLNYG